MSHENKPTIRLHGKYKHDIIEAEIFLDNCAVEIFTDGGEDVISACAYIESQFYRIVVIKNIDLIEANEINI